MVNCNVQTVTVPTPTAGWEVGRVFPTPLTSSLVVPFALANEMRWELTWYMSILTSEQFKESLCSTRFFSALRPAMSHMGASLQAGVPEEQGCQAELPIAGDGHVT